jgi:large conductance mechanosensitive channel
MLQEFKDFITKGNIVEVAVGLVMALYFQAIIDALLEGVLYPIIAAIFGKPDFRAIGFDIGDAFISIGLVIDAAISFVIVALILFLVLKGYNKLKAEQEAEDSGPSEVELLAEIRDQLRANNG